MAVAGLAIGCLLLPACSAHVDKAGGAGVTTLHLALDDPAGRETGREVEEFARQVRRRSEGRVRVAVTYQPNGANPGGAWDQRIAKQVQAGTYDVGLVPARAWDKMGVTSFQPLAAPFLVTTDAQLDAVVTDPVAGKMLRGLRGHGVIGLALLPESIRHPAGFSTSLVRPGDFAGNTVRAPLSALTYETLRALGATPEPLDGAPLTIGVAHGEVVGADTSIELLPTLPTPNTITVNIPLYAKANALIVNTLAFGKLDPDLRAAVRAAALATVGRMVATRKTDLEKAGEACAAGGTIVLATPSDVAAVRRALAPVRDQLDADAALRPILTRVKQVVARHPAQSDITACGRPAEAVPAAGDLLDPRVLNGVWRFELTRAQILAVGLGPDVADKESGVSTIRLDSGRYVWDWRPPVGPQQCRGSYVVTKTSVSFHEDSDCGAWSAADYQLSGRTLAFRSGHSLNEGDHDAALLQPLWYAHAWQRISPVP
jgi:TRAP-type C4-dicarboxylate transport system substrate-binding protein